MVCDAALRDSIVDAVRRSSEGRRVAVACSGGLDSGLVSALAKRYADSVTLYTCGTANAFDVAMARDLANRLDLPWVHVKISPSNIEEIISGVSEAGETDDPFTISYELQLYCVLMAAEEDIVLTGQGSDELFMGCAKFVGVSDGDFLALEEASLARLDSISVPCEQRIAAHFGKTLLYPYLEESVRKEAARIGPLAMKPRSMESRKAVLKEVAEDLEYGFLAGRTKKSSQYGSGTTDLVRAMAREKGMGYDEYIASVCRSPPGSKRGAIVSARIDPVLKAKAEKILEEHHTTVSDEIASLYKRIVREGRP
jgi:asparagine synthase (glutamine-hydrolysing)